MQEMSARGVPKSGTLLLRGWGGEIAGLGMFTVSARGRTSYRERKPVDWAALCARLEWVSCGGVLGFISFSPPLLQQQQFKGALGNLNKLSPRRTPGSRYLIELDSGVRRNDERGLVQGFPYEMTARCSGNAPPTASRGIPRSSVTKRPPCWTASANR